MELGNNINGDIVLIEYLVREIREEQNLTLDQLSKKTGISKSHLNNIENNFKHPTLPVLVEIAMALKVDITDLYKILIITK